MNHFASVIRILLIMSIMVTSPNVLASLPPSPIKPVFMKTTVNNPSPFVNEQILYTVRLYTNTQFMDAEYLPPQVDHALLIPLGKAQRYQTTLDGQAYVVEEQRYALSPQQSGPITIEAPAFRAVIFDTVPREIHAHVKPTIIQVKPAPTGIHQWLPSDHVALTEVYSTDGLTLKQGDTLTRTVTLQAEGIPAQLLPTIAFPNTSQLSVYAEKPTLQNIGKENGLIGRSDVTVTYVLKKAHRVTIPGITLPWFNPKTGEHLRATLPARILTVTPTTSQIRTMPKPTLESKQTPRLVPAPPRRSKHGPLGVALLLTTVLVILLWLFFKPRWARHRTQRQLLHDVRTACLANDPKATLAALLAWTHHRWPDSYPTLRSTSRSLSAGSNDLGIELQKKISLLSEVLYAKTHPITWQGAAFWHSLKATLRKKPRTIKTRQDLPPINPNDPTEGT